MLLVKELNAKLLHHLVDERHLLMAITPPSASAEFDYERLELLGELPVTCAPRLLYTIWPLQVMPS
jgi:hypothetical protein